MFTCIEDEIFVVGGPMFTTTYDGQQVSISQLNDTKLRMQAPWGALIEGGIYHLLCNNLCRADGLHWDTYYVRRNPPHFGHPQGDLYLLPANWKEIGYPIPSCEPIDIGGIKLLTKN